MSFANMFRRCLVLYPLDIAPALNSSARGLSSFELALGRFAQGLGKFV
jgi:hypothetical protein